MVIDYVEVPPDVLLNHRHVTLAADIMFVNKMPILVTVSRTIRFVTAERLINRKGITIATSIRSVIKLYMLRGFKIHTCLMDSEFECFREDLLDNFILLNCCGTK